MSTPEATSAAAGVAAATPRPGRQAAVPDRIPLPALPDEHRTLREIFLVLFCAAFAAAVFFLWTFIRSTWLGDLSTDDQQVARNIKDLIGLFLTAYVAARLYSSMVRRYERQLERHRRLLAHILNESGDAIVTVDAQDRISTWNRGASQIFGFDESEILGRHVNIIFPSGSDPDAELAQIRDQVEDQGVLRSYEVERITRTGKRIKGEITCTVLRDARGRYAGRTVIFRDVTERERIRAELTRKQSLAAVGEMAAAIAHEIKNPLMGIMGAVQVISRSFAEDDRRRAVVNEVLDQVKRLDATIRELLSFARPTVARPGAIELLPFTRRILSVLREEPVFRGRELHNRIPAGLVIQADPQLLENILINLLLNAGEAMGPEGGRITLEAAVRADETLIAVEDDGPGIPDEVLQNIYKPFFTTKHHGTGLGLSNVRKLVEVMAGRVEVETQKGHGTRFTIRLPLDQAAPAEESR